MGPPKHKHVYLQENGKRICWKEQGASGSNGNRYVVIKEITGISDGRDSKKFKRFKTESANQEAMSFSVHTKKRTLDLEASNIADKLQFIDDLKLIMKQ